MDKSHSEWFPGSTVPLRHFYQVDLFLYSALTCADTPKALSRQRLQQLMLYNGTDRSGNKPGVGAERKTPVAVIRDERELLGFQGQLDGQAAPNPPSMLHLHKVEICVTDESMTDL